MNNQCQIQALFAKYLAEGSHGVHYCVGGSSGGPWVLFLATMKAIETYQSSRSMRVPLLTFFVSRYTKGGIAKVSLGRLAAVDSAFVLAFEPGTSLECVFFV